MAQVAHLALVALDRSDAGGAFSRQGRGYTLLGRELLQGYRARLAAKHSQLLDGIENLLLRKPGNVAADLDQADACARDPASLPATGGIGSKSFKWKKEFSPPAVAAFLGRLLASFFIPEAELERVLRGKHGPSQAAGGAHLLQLALGGDDLLPIVSIEFCSQNVIEEPGGAVAFVV